jgi:hypothetical protein
MNASGCVASGHGSPRRVCVARLVEDPLERSVKQLRPVDGSLDRVEQNTIFPSPVGRRAAGMG